MTTNRQRLTSIIMTTALLAFTLLPVTPARAMGLLVTGQTTAYQAEKNNGLGLDKVPDDGALQRGVALHYKVLQDGTIKDVNTGLVWEVKCSSCGGLHDAANTYRWSGNGYQETIWDWLDDINTEGGTGYAGHNDWRIPNVRELESILDFAELPHDIPAIDPIFGPTGPFSYWSSTTFVFDPSQAWFVDFGDRTDGVWGKSYIYPFRVRAVRGGPK